MAESPTFSGFSNSDAADAFAKVISQIKSDMAAIEASAKNIEKSLSKASRHTVGGGSSFGASNAGGNTGSAKPTGMTLGEITAPYGGTRAVATASAFGMGAVGGAVSGGGALAGGIALAALPDLIVRPQTALDREKARFGVAQSTGDFGSFQRMLDVAKNDFNVQDRTAFANSLVAGTQRFGMVGMMGGGEVGERRAAQQIGSYNTLAAMSGVDPYAVPGAMASAQSTNAYYSGLAGGIQTRDPVTGQPIGIEGQMNQMYRRNSAVWNTMSEEDILADIDRTFAAPGSTGRLELETMYGGNQDAVNMALEALRIQAKQGGEPLKEGAIQEQMKALGEEGAGLGSEMTQGMEGVNRLESERLDLEMTYLNDATAGIEEAAKHIANAVELLSELEGPLKAIVGGYTTLANQMDVFQTETPGMTKGLTDFAGGVGETVMNGLMLKGGYDLLRKVMPGKKGLPGGGGGLLSKLMMGLAAGGAVAGGTEMGEEWLEGKGKNLPGWTRSGGQASFDFLQGGLSAGAGAAALTKNPTVVAFAAAVGAIINGGRSLQDWSQGEGDYEGMGKGSKPGKSKGDWFVEADQDGRIHYGEMILPARVATAVREELAVGKTSSAEPRRDKSAPVVNINLTIQRATDQEAIAFANRVKRLIDSDQEMMSIGRAGG